MPTGFQEMVLNGEQDGLPSQSLPVKFGTYLSQHSLFVSLEPTEEKEKFYIVLLLTIKSRHIKTMNESLKLFLIKSEVTQIMKHIRNHYFNTENLLKYYQLNQQIT